MNDPAGGVPPQLLPHMHLVSRHRYPAMTQLSLDTVVEYLIQAPRITRDMQPMHWMFIDAPQDGSVMLVWQPSAHLGTNFATDGYVWADPEQAFNSEARGYTVEMWLHRAGYHPPNETVAQHCRKRYRLTPSRNPNPNIPPCDPSLWIVHYSRADQNDQVPADRIPMIPQVQQALQQRRFLHSQGQLVRKEFMLHDRNNWPTINFPAVQTAQAFAQGRAMYPQDLIARQQQQAFFPQSKGGTMPGAVGPSPRRAPPPASGHVRGPSGSMGVAATGEPTLEDEEDVSRGDAMDFLTPRDISKMRYQQHHEWMEGVFSSPYATSQIVPVDLGIGRKGELESLTRGFFDAPTGLAQQTKETKDNTPPRIGKMDPAQAEEFTNRATQKVADMAAELEAMKKRHAKRLAKLERTNALKDAERRLRDAQNDPIDYGTGIWRLEGQSDPAGEMANPYSNQSKEKVNDILREVESFYGKRIEVVPDLACIQKGGLEEKSEANGEVSRNQGFDRTLEFTNGHNMERDMESSNTAGGLLDQFHTSNSSTPAQLLTSIATPTAPPETVQQAPSAGGTPAAPINEMSANPRDPSIEANLDQRPETIPSIADMDVDVEMAGLGDEDDQIPASGEGDGSEWVMVNNDEKPAEGEEVPAEVEEELNEINTPHDQSAMQQSNDTPGAFMNTPGSGLQGLTPAEPTEPTTDTAALEESHHFDDAGDFSNIDSAGDALAAYGDEQNEELSLDGLDNSAFGEAFHASDAENHDTGDIS